MVLAAKWLLIFDNVESSDALDDFWPAAKHGAILVTTRSVLVATLPIDTGLEVKEFEPEQGAEFLLRITPDRRQTDGELDDAAQVARQLGGLPLALNQMAALINARNCSIKDFAILYSKHEQRLHGQRNSGWKYLGYSHTLDTVWELSFASLGVEARVCLGMLSFLSADSVPSALFSAPDDSNVSNILAFCKDDLRFVGLLSLEYSCS